MSTTVSERPAWALDVDAVLAHTDPMGGLSPQEASERLQEFGRNRLDEPPRIPRWRKFVAQFADPLVYLLLVAVVVSLVAWILEGHQGLPYDVLVIALIVVANAVLGYVQEARAEHAVAALMQLAAATATVVRGGTEQVIPSEELVPGDVLVLDAGDSIEADGRLIEAAALMVSEASLTGESQPVLKDTESVGAETPLGDRLGMVFAGTAVASGRGRAVVTNTGMGTQIGTIADLMSTTADDPTPLQREIGYVGRALGIAVVVIAVVVVAAIVLTSDLTSASDVVDVLLVGVSLAVAAVPEGLPAVLSLVLALGVQRMAGKRAIVKRLLSVETLGSASVVCTDKTGTLTRNEMAVQAVVTPSGSAEVTGTGYTPSGDIIPHGDDPAILEEVRAVLAGGSLASDATLQQVDGEWTIQGDPTEAAFLVAEAKLDGVTDARTARFERVGEIPFTSERKLMTTLQADHDQGGRVAAVTKGAPDILLTRCTGERVDDQVRPLTDDRREEILREVDRLAGRALRTLGVAYRPLTSAEVTTDEGVVEHDLVYLGMVGIIDPPRDEVRGSIEEARRAGIRVLMVTGDHPITAARIAEDLGITARGDPAMTGRDLDRLDGVDLHAAVRTTSVFARVAPEHKLRIVDALQADGHIVAMTGDGVNDAPALKSADIGVAMGVTGTDVAKQASDMILTDDNFATIISAVAEGRAIFANIRRFLRFLLSSNIGEVLTMFFGVVLAGMIGLGAAGNEVAIPLLAVQILWINLLTDTAPALALGVDPAPDDLMSRPARRPTDRVIDAAMWRGIAWVGVVMAVVSLAALDLGMEGGVLGGDGDVVRGRTMAFTTLVLAQLFNVFNARSDHSSAFRNLFTNAWLWSAVVLSLALQIAVVQIGWLNHAFGTTPLTAGQWLACVSLASMVLWTDEAKKLLAGRWRVGHHRSVGVR